MNPIPTVRVVVLDSAGRVLLLRRAGTSHALGRWCLPGGKVDYGDTAAQTVAKELAEEASLVCTSTDFLFYQDACPPSRGECTASISTSDACAAERSC